MARVKTYCPICSADIAKSDAVQIWRDHEFSFRRSRAAEAVAESLWAATQSLLGLLHRRQETDKAEESAFTPWEEEDLQQALEAFRSAQVAFKDAREAARL